MGNSQQESFSVCVYVVVGLASVKFSLNGICVNMNSARKTHQHGLAFGGCVYSVRVVVGVLVHTHTHIQSFISVCGHI